jgi:catechol 2,3-dioxygenase-like lactoylglutathione lyase family enzyme
MIDHISVGVADLKRARQFYDRVLAALGYERVHDIDIPGEGVVGHGYGWHGQAVFWIGQPEKADRTANRSGGNHVAFRAATRKAVRAFEPFLHFVTLYPFALAGRTNGTMPARSAGYPWR